MATTICVDCGEEVDVEGTRDDRCGECQVMELGLDNSGAPLAVDHYMERVRKRGWWF